MQGKQSPTILTTGEKMASDIEFGSSENVKKPPHHMSICLRNDSDLEVGKGFLGNVVWENWIYLCVWRSFLRIWPCNENSHTATNFFCIPLSTGAALKKMLLPLREVEWRVIIVAARLHRQKWTAQSSYCRTEVEKLLEKKKTLYQLFIWDTAIHETNGRNILLCN